MITPEILLYKVAKILQELKIPYAVTGGMAVVAWGEPRYTADIDIIVELVPEKLPYLKKKLLSIDKDVYISEEAMKDALERKGEFNFIHPQTGLKVDFWVKGDSLYDKLKIKRAIARKVGKQKIFFVSPEDLILSKLIWYKESESSKHLEDIKTILSNLKLKLDLNYIKNWSKKHSTIKILNEIIKK